MTNPHKLASIKAFRRERLSALLDEHGKVGLSKLVDISADYLWQMGKGAGKSARGVNDENAAKIEAALGKPSGWMDGEPPDSASKEQSQSVRLDPLMIDETYTALSELYEESGRVFCSKDDLEKFLHAYQLRVQMPVKPSDKELMAYGRKLAVLAPQGAMKDGRGDSVPPKGTDSGKLPRGVRRKA